MSYEEFAALYAPYKDLLTPDNLYFATAPNGEPVGFFLNFPDFSHQQPDSTILAKMMGVLPEYASTGVGSMMVGEFVRRLHRESYTRIVSSLRIEGNISRQFGKGLYEVYKEYALFGLEL